MNALEIAQSCPKFEGCNAAYCPAVGGKHLKGDRVCLYLREAVKANGNAIVRGALPETLAELVIADATHLMGGSAPLSVELQRASQSGSKIERGARFAAQPQQETTV